MGGPAWRAELGQIQLLLTFLPGRPRAASQRHRCPCCSPLSLHFPVMTCRVLGKSAGSFCFEPGPGLSHGEEEIGILFGSEDGIRGPAFLCFGLHWRESQAKGSCASTTSVHHARAGCSLRDCRATVRPAGWTRPGPARQCPASRVPWPGPARRSPPPAGLS